MLLRPAPVMSNNTTIRSPMCSRKCLSIHQLTNFFTIWTWSGSFLVLHTWKFTGRHGKVDILFLFLLEAYKLCKFETMSSFFTLTVTYVFLSHLYLYRGRKLHPSHAYVLGRKTLLNLQVGEYSL